MDARGLVNRLRQLKQTQGARDEAIWPGLRTLTVPSEMAAVGRALDGLSVASFSPAGQTYRPIRLGVVSSFNADAVVPFLRLLLVLEGFAPEFYIAGFNQYVRELADPSSGLAAFEPQATLCLLHDQVFLPEDWSGNDPERLRQHALAQVERVAALCAGFSERTTGSLILNTVPLSPTELYSVVGLRNRAKLGRIWREVNGGLLGLTEQCANLSVIDLECLLVDHPGELQDRRLYRYASMAWRDEVLLVAAREAVNLCRAHSGRAKKCLVVDLDNTLWGGVLGDDGPEGIQVGHMYPGNCHRELQRRIKALESQGVILGICSKNERKLVDEVLTEHPELLVRSEDFAVIVANWEPKDRNLRMIAEQLNIGLESLVFLDDSRFECELVAASLPEVTVVHLHGDPADHVDRLLRRGLFDVPATTAEDRQRTEKYRAQVLRQEFAGSFSSGEEYLRKLDIRIRLFAVDAYALPRLVQLNLRTNQFNMTTQRLTEADVKAQAEADDYLVLGFEAADRFGHEGMVGGIWVRKEATRWRIENFIMSCRVFARKIEHVVLQYVIDQAVEAGVDELYAEYRTTPKNKVVADFYPNVGFSPVEQSECGTTYRLSLLERAALAPDWITCDVKEARLTGV